MKSRLLGLMMLAGTALSGQHTFSIVAVDTLTGEVGGAGATCYQTVNDIADCHPGVGFIHTQSYVDYTNQAYARTLMNAGVMPEQIMDSLQAHDAQNAPQYRQYGAVVLQNPSGPRAAAFTGTNCFNYKGQRAGATYAIAGNILLGPQILDSMEARFNRCTGSLADKLMEAMEGAKVDGADSRCLQDSVSSLSAYMMVAKPADVLPNIYLNLNIESVYPLDPIDVLHQQYLQFLSMKKEEILKKGSLRLYPNPALNGDLQVEMPEQTNLIHIYDAQGRLVTEWKKEGNGKLAFHIAVPGIYLVVAKDQKGNQWTSKWINQ